MDLVPLLTGVAGGIPAFLAAWFAYRSSSSANKVENRKVDNEAYEKAQAAYERLLDRLQRQVDVLQSNLDRVNGMLASEQDVSNKLRNQIRLLTSQLAELEATIVTRGENSAPGRLTK